MIKLIQVNEGIRRQSTERSRYVFFLFFFACRIPWSIGASVWVFLQQLWLGFMFLVLAVLELESKVGIPKRLLGEKCHSHENEFLGWFLLFSFSCGLMMDHEGLPFYPFWLVSLKVGHVKKTGLDIKGRWLFEKLTRIGSSYCTGQWRTALAIWWHWSGDTHAHMYVLYI